MTTPRALDGGARAANCGDGSGSGGRGDGVQGRNVTGSSCVVQSA